MRPREPQRRIERPSRRIVRIFEVWESREDFERFVKDRLMPILQELAPGDDREPQTVVYELHSYMAGGQ